MQFWYVFAAFSVVGKVAVEGVVDVDPAEVVVASGVDEGKFVSRIELDCPRNPHAFTSTKSRA